MWLLKSVRGGLGAGTLTESLITCCLSHLSGQARNLLSFAYVEPGNLLFLASVGAGGARGGEEAGRGPVLATDVPRL